MAQCYQLFRHCWVHRYGAVKIFLRGTHSDRHCRKLDHLSSLRADNMAAKHPPGGLGIGLALVRALVEMHGGNVTAESEGAVQASTFTAPLPALEGPSGAAGEVPGPQVAPGAGLNVLLVDDNVDAAESMAIILQMDGHATRVASHGHKALEIATDFKPQAVFLDIGMPGMDGYQVAKALLSEHVAHRPVLIALTGWGTKQDRARTKAAGFDYHLTKPASIEVVEQLLESLHVAA